MEKKDLKEMTIEEMQEESLRCALEICKLRSIVERHQKRFNDLTYQLWKKMENEKSNVSANTESN